MNRPRTLSAAGRSRRIGPAGAALLLILLAGACAAPSVPPPPAESQPPPTSTAQAAAAATERPAPEAAAPEREDETLSALSADESDATPAAREPAAGEDDAAVAPEATLPSARVGLLLPLSGRYASEGETLLRAAQLALLDTECLQRRRPAVAPREELLVAQSSASVDNRLPVPVERAGSTLELEGCQRCLHGRSAMLPSRPGVH